MSGGAFDYQQYRFDDVASQIEEIIAKSEKSPEIIERFKEAALTCRKAAIMAQRVDWFVSGDDGPESFMTRWDEEFAKLDDPHGKDSERLDKLEEFIKNSRDGIAIQFDDSCTNQWMLFLLSWQCGSDGWSGGIGLDDSVSRCNADLRSAIDSLKKD